MLLLFTWSRPIRSIGAPTIRRIMAMGRITVIGTTEAGEVTGATEAGEAIGATEAMEEGTGTGGVNKAEKGLPPEIIRTSDEKRL
jgi:hypothetical protein